MYPALAILQNLMKTNNVDVLWVGSEGGMEASIVERVGVTYKAIPAAGIHGTNLFKLPINIYKIIIGILYAWKILYKFKPHVNLFTGGYVAFPLALASRIPFGMFKKPKNFVFVPDIEAGLALKTIARFADTIALTAEKSKNYFPSSANTFVSGYPVREEFYLATRAKAHQHFKLEPHLPVILVFGGSLGARSINQALLGSIMQILTFSQVIHVCGKLNWQEVHEKKVQITSKNPELAKRYFAFDYLYDDMHLALQAADLVICRSGASTLGELPAAGVGAFLVPYPHAWRYQVVNATYLADKGAAVIIRDDELNQVLLPKIKEYLFDKEKLAKMQAAMKSLARPEAAANISQAMFALSKAYQGEKW